MTSSESDSEESKMEITPKVNYYKQKKRGFTISIVVPSSIIDNA